MQDMYCVYVWIIRFRNTDSMGHDLLETGHWRTIGLAAFKLAVINSTTLQTL